MYYLKAVPKYQLCRSPVSAVPQRFISVAVHKFKNGVEYFAGINKNAIMELKTTSALHHSHRGAALPREHTLAVSAGRFCRGSKVWSLAGIEPASAACGAVSACLPPQQNIGLVGRAVSCVVSDLRSRVLSRWWDICTHLYTTCTSATDKCLRRKQQCTDL